MENIRIAIYFSALSLFAITYVVKSELNINTVYEKFIPRGGDTALFGASLALHESTIYAGSPGDTSIYTCGKGGSSCSRTDEFDDVESTSMLGISMGASENKVFTCAPRTDLKYFAQNWSKRSLGKIRCVVNISR